MNEPRDHADPLKDPRLHCEAQYIKGLEDEAQRMFALLRLSTFLHGLNDLAPVAAAVLGALTSSDGYDFAEAVLFLRHEERSELVGCEAVRAGESEFGRRLWEMVDRFPESIDEFVGLCGSAGQRARELELARVRWPEASEGVTPEQQLETWERALAQSPAVQNALGAGPWRFLLLRGTQGPIALLAVRPHPERPGADPGAESSVDSELLLGFCYHSGIALERGLLRRRIERRVDELHTVQQVSRSILTATNLEDLLLLVSRTAAKAVGADWASAWVSEGSEDELRLLARWGGAKVDDRLAEELESRARHVALSQKPDERPAIVDGVESVLVPLVAFERTVGVLGVGGRSVDRALPLFHRGDVDFLSLLCAQAAVAVKNAQLFGQVKETERRLRETQNLLLQSEKLAALGEMSAKVAHEIRNPLSAVGGFARRIQRNLPTQDPNAQFAELIVKEIERLEAILTEQLEFARMSRPRLQNLDPNVLVKETLLLLHDAAHQAGVILLEEITPDLPPVLLDGDKVKQVLLNILRNALEAVSEGNRILVRTARVDGDLRIEIANDGQALPGDILDSLFVPFATAKPGGTGLGLAVARQIVQDHGGEIQVRTGAEPWSVIFTISFPIRENQDRRRSPRERRATRDRRRAA
ncbi:MAG: GAF domain-containing protein [Candidatus Eisenbacteria bacterium]|nr:GAF domain-containing protein [Candidatus Eisenbacteria bacterium]